jgi:hypothetical protein
MRKCPGELGWLTKRIKIRIKTSIGKKMTTPKGTEIVEFPFNRSGRRKKAMRESTGLLCLESLFSSRGSCRGGLLGATLVALRIKSMARKSLPRRQVL